MHIPNVIAEGLCKVMGAVPSELDTILPRALPIFEMGCQGAYESYEG